MKGMKFKRDSILLYHSQQRTSKRAAKLSFEELVNKIDAEGRYQYCLIFGFMFPLAICYSLASANIFLLLSTPDHFCHVPGREKTTWNLEEWRNLTIPLEEDSEGQMQFSSCQMYNSTDVWKKDAQNISVVEQVSMKLPVKPNLIGCQHGWEFDKSTWNESLVEHFEWVCRDSYLVTTLFTLSYVGNAVGTFIFTLFADKFGRKPTFYAALTLNAVFGVLCILSPFSEAFIAFKVVLSFAFHALYQLPYVIVVEICSERLRCVTAVSSFVGCVIGTCLVSPFTYVFTNWKVFIAVCHLPFLVFILYSRVLPESPRWLLSKGRVIECENIFKRMARINRNNLRGDFQDLLLQAQADEMKKLSFTSILLSRVLVKNLILTCLLLSIGYILYSGLILNIHNMNGSKEFNFFILALIQIPGKLIGSISAQYFGRRMSAVLFIGLAASCCALTSLYITKSWTMTTLCVMAKMFTGASVLVTNMFIGELFPTSLRSSVYGIASIVSIAAMTITPPLMVMHESNIRLPYYILCGIGLLGAFFSTFLPETVGNPLPQTIKDAMDIGVNQPYCKIIHKWNAYKYMNRKHKPRGVIVSRMVF